MELLGTVSFVFFGLGVAYMLHHWRGEPDKTFSQNAARERTTILYYSWLVFIFLGLLSWFTFAWLVPARQLPVLFGVSFAVGVVSQAVAAIVPETRGVKARIHRAGAAVMYFSTLAVVAELALNAPGVTALLIWLAWVLMAATMVVAIGSERARRQAVLLQAVHFGLFAAAFTMATFTA